MSALTRHNFKSQCRPNLLVFNNVNLLEAHAVFVYLVYRVGPYTFVPATTSRRKK